MNLFLSIHTKCCNWKRVIPSPIGILTLIQFVVLFVYFLAQTIYTPSLPSISPSFLWGKSISANTTEELKKIFSEYNYNLENIKNGKTPVPFLLLETLPNNFHKTKQVEKRKKLFIKIVLPMALAVNRRIETYRDAVLTLSKRQNNLNGQEEKWLTSIAKLHNRKINETNLLLEQLAPIPVSLFLAQSAIESGWGTSRFAKEGNALFGQWTWKPGSGIIPKNRDSGKKYEVKAFTTLINSVWDYARNLNTHWAYSDFRRERSKQILSGGIFSVLLLIKTLKKYSQQGQSYLELIDRIIKQNDLLALDNARLAN